MRRIRTFRHMLHTLIAVWLYWRKHPHLGLGQIVWMASNGNPFYAADECIVGYLFSNLRKERVHARI